MAGLIIEHVYLAFFFRVDWQRAQRDYLETERCCFYRVLYTRVVACSSTYELVMINTTTLTTKYTMFVLYINTKCTVHLDVHRYRIVQIEPMRWAIDIECLATCFSLYIADSKPRKRGS